MESEKKNKSGVANSKAGKYMEKRRMFFGKELQYANPYHCVLYRKWDYDEDSPNSMVIKR